MSWKSKNCETHVLNKFRALEVVEVFGYFNCNDFGSHLTKTHKFTISTN